VGDDIDIGMEQNFRPSKSGTLLPALRSVHAVNSGQREKEKMLSLQPCFLGHRWHPYRDLETGRLVFACHTCGEFRDYDEARSRKEGVAR
jgi:hypothetical protein